MKKLLFTLFFVWLICYVSAQGQGTLNTSGKLELKSQSNVFSPSILSFKSRGTTSSPTAVSLGDTLFYLQGLGHIGSQFVESAGAKMKFISTQNWTNNGQGTNISFETTQNGTQSTLPRLTIGHDGSIGIGITEPTKPLHIVRGSPSGATPNSNAGIVLDRGLNHSYINLLVDDAFESGILFGRQTEGAASGGIIYDSGKRLLFRTNTNDTQMTINADGNVGIGTANPESKLETMTDGTTNRIVLTQYTGTGIIAPHVQVRRAAGTSNAPLAVPASSTIGAITAAGYNGSDFTGNKAGIFFATTEAWTSDANGTSMNFQTTASGTTNISTKMTITDIGRVGIGTVTPNERLHVNGNIIVNGCVKDNNGNVIAGTCSSDARFKQNITPFTSLLNKFIQLQPVHYHWRAEQFPEKHFGKELSYGLIAQEVEKIFPDLVSIDEQGYKMVNYSKLPLLSIQAIKELKEENEQLKQQQLLIKNENDLLKRKLEMVISKVEIIEASIIK